MRSTRRCARTARTALPVLLALACAACGPRDGADGGATQAGGASPPGTDIWLADLATGPDGRLVVGTPMNVTSRPGYDNQPMFTPDGSGFWYTAIDAHTGETDIWRYSIGTGEVTRVIASNPESEYSATPLPDGTGLAVVRVEADSAQRLWRFDLDGSNPRVLFPDVEPVGYFAFAGPETVVMYVLGEPPTLRVARLEGGEARVVADDVGRSIQPIPGTTHVSFVRRHGDDGTTTIERLDPATGATEVIAPGVDGGDFHAWTPDGRLLQASGAVLYAWDADAGAWQPVADFTDLGIRLSRLAVRPDGAQIALVAERVSG